MKRTWKRKDMRLASVKYVPRQELLDILFENGDRFLIPTAVSPARDITGAEHVAPLDWAESRIRETGDAIEIPADESLSEIPWDRIRAMADPEFRAHLADCATDRAKRLGSRIQTLRQERGLSRAELAEKVGSTRATIADFETGKATPSVEMIEHVAVALGKQLRDFSCE